MSGQDTVALVLLVVYLIGWIVIWRWRPRAEE